jgi:uncharacterized protein (TIGR02271 family)
MPRVPAPSPRPVPRAATLVAAREEAVVEKRRVVPGKVRVSTRIREHTAQIDERLASEDVVVTRKPIDRVVDGPIAPRQEGDTYVVSVVEEVLRVEKRYVLKEEVRIQRRRTERPHRERVTLRSQDVVVERDAPAREPAARRKSGSD